MKAHNKNRQCAPTGPDAKTAAVSVYLPMRIKIAILAFLFCVLAWADTDPIELEMQGFGLKKFEIANIPHDQRFTNRKYVSIRNGALNVDSSRLIPNVQRLVVDDLEYVGIDNGEWGGKLEVVKNGVASDLMRGNIVHLSPIEGGLYIFEGLAHLSMRQGSVHFIPDIKSPTPPELIVTLPDAPELVYLDSARPEYLRFLIVGSMSVMSLDHEINYLDILYWDAFWSIWLNPTSVVRVKDRYFIGFPHGVAVMPAPWGPTSVHCKRDCSPIEFYADSEF